MRRLVRIALIAFTAVIASALTLGSAPPAHAAGETFKVLSTITPGCAHAQFFLNVEKAGWDGASYTVHTVVTAGGRVYMNEAASNSGNGQTPWGLFDNFNYAPVPNPGTWPASGC